MLNYNQTYRSNPIPVVPEKRSIFRRFVQSLRGCFTSCCVYKNDENCANWAYVNYKCAPPQGSLGQTYFTYPVSYAQNQHSPYYNYNSPTTINKYNNENCEENQENVTQKELNCYLNLVQGLSSMKDLLRRHENKESIGYMILRKKVKSLERIVVDHEKYLERFYNRPFRHHDLSPNFAPRTKNRHSYDEIFESTSTSTEYRSYDNYSTQHRWFQKKQSPKDEAYKSYRKRFGQEKLISVVYPENSENSSRQEVRIKNKERGHDRRHHRH